MEGDAGCYYHSGSSNDWDLNAVVRYACGGRVPPPSSDDPFSSFLQPPAPDVTDNGMPDATASLPLLDLPVSDYPAVVDELFNAFFAQSAPPQQQPAAPVATNERTPQQQPAAEATNQSAPQLQPALDDPPPSIPQPTGTGRHASGGQGQRSRRKKKQVKKVVQRVAADGTTADPWAWRKYGQKPIKGSPYPRGYYRCSTDKACEARKMVERCSTDPDSFILTYTGGDHNHPVPIHRNSLAGTTRNRQQPSPNAPEPAAVGQSAPAATATEAAAALSPAQSTSGGMSPTTSPRSPSMEEYHQEEDLDEAGASLLPKDVEMAGEEDELLTSFLNPCYEPAIDGSVSYMAAEDGHGGAGIMSPLLNVVQETFVVTPWVTTALDDGDATGWS